VYERAVIEAHTRAAVAGHVRSMPGLETGGILIGYEADPKTVLITRVSPPGPAAVHRRYFFSRDTRFLQRSLDRFHDQSDGREDYIGEWHVHPALDAPPSYVDRRALWRIARRNNYAPTNPVLLIVEEAPPERRLRVYGFVATPKRAWGELAVALTSHA
jgi:integrative and conjugative element protein (TIGR02256 family)